VCNIGHRSDYSAILRKETADSPQYAPRVDEMLQNIAEHNHVEALGAQQFAQVQTLNVSDDDSVAKFAGLRSGLGIQFETYDGASTAFQDFRYVSGGWPYLQNSLVGSR
jgi:hypothetical protein